MFKPVSPKVDFPKLEQRLLRWWYKNGIVDRYLKRNNRSRKRFSFLDGPITANNPMGVHHAWGRTYKDLWQRFYNMLGYRQRFQNGFDCQGLWVEVEVEKELGIRNKKEIENLVPGDRQASIAKFVELCKQRVRKFSLLQTEQSKRLGYFMDWQHSYYTMSDENNYMIWHFLKICQQKGWIYKGRDSVPWCPRCETAISQHEMLTEDYKELKHQSVFIKLPITSPGWQKTVLLVWTTTPWTVPGNIAVAVNPDFTYRGYKDKKTGEMLIFLRGDKRQSDSKEKQADYADFVENILTGVEKRGNYQGIQDYQGSELVGLKYQGPYDDFPRVKKVRKQNPATFHTVVEAKDLVVATKGTGLLHVATGAGTEDFRLGLAKNLPILNVIDERGNYLEGMGFFSGKNAKNQPEIVLNDLKRREGGRYFLKTQWITHRYPVCWRCKTELVWRVTDEWYIAMDKPSKSKVKSQPRLAAGRKSKANKTLRQMMIEVAKKIRWIPDFGLDREIDWLTNMHDWLISKKNRYWGLALPIWECNACGNFEIIGGKAELKRRAVAGWEDFEGKSPHKPQIDAIKIRCSSCGKIISRIEPVGNPWLDAGIVAYSTLSEGNQGEPLYLKDKKKWRQWFPADFITESFPGQFKNWFYSLIAMSTVLEGKAPFRTVLGFATLLGEDGRPMHKSWGNAIEFNEGAERIGVDVMRWLYTSHSPEQNLLFGYRKADETRRRFHLIVWNIYNFFVTYANVDKFKVQSSKFKVNNRKLTILDRWILLRLDQAIKTVTESLKNYNAFVASGAIEDFVDDLSRWYVRRSRNRVGPTAGDSEDKKTCYRVLYHVLLTLSKLLAPFTPFIAEEIYKNLTNDESVHLADWPEIQKSTLAGGRQEVKSQKSKILIEKMKLVRRVCELAHAERKKAGIKVRQPLKKLEIANVKLQLGEEFEDLIKEELNIKEVKYIAGKGELKVRLDTSIAPELKAEGEARELIRQIQVLRKKAKCRLEEEIVVVAPSWPADFEEMIMQKTLTKRIIWGKCLHILRD